MARNAFDCARHFYSVDTILRYLDLMALFKFFGFIGILQTTNPIAW